jgi:hypothetical protein
VCFNVYVIIFFFLGCLFKLKLSAVENVKPPLKKGSKKKNRFIQSNPTQKGKPVFVFTRYALCKSYSWKKVFSNYAPTIFFHHKSTNGRRVFLSISRATFKMAVTSAVENIANNGKVFHSVEIKIRCQPNPHYPHNIKVNVSNFLNENTFIRQINVQITHKRFSLMAVLRTFNLLQRHLRKITTKQQKVSFLYQHTHTHTHTLTQYKETIFKFRGK